MDLENIIQEEVDKRVKEEREKFNIDTINNNTTNLQEIIEICGEELFCIKRYKDGWVAEGGEDRLFNRCGKTPFEAICSFYIDLKK